MPGYHDITGTVRLAVADTLQLRVLTQSENALVYFSKGSHVIFVLAQLDGDYVCLVHDRLCLIDETWLHDATVHVIS